MKRTLQHRKGVFALLLALSLGMGTAYAYDFSAVCSTGQTLYYNIIDATNHYVEITCPGTENDPWPAEFTKPSGPFVLPADVTHGGVIYSVTKIGDRAFYSCTDLTGSLTISNSVTSIGDFAFYLCSGFTGQLIIPNSVTTIGTCAFRNCTGFMGTLTIGSGVAFIGNQAFNICYNLTSMTVLPATPPFLGPGVFYSMPITTPVYVHCESLSAYQNATGWNSFLYIQCGPITFADSAVKAICVANWDTNGDGELSYAEAATVTSLGNVFQENYNITSFNELQYFTGVSAIEQSAFENCIHLTSITLPPFLSSIGYSAFYDCSALTSIVIPASVTSLEWTPFPFCTALESITMEAGPNNMYHCEGNAIIDINHTLVVGCKNTVIPDDVTAIGDGAFLGCSALTQIDIPSSVTHFGIRVFSYCEGLTSFTIPASVTSIDANAFTYCSGLTELTVLATTPPTLGTWVFGVNNFDIPVYVPCGSLEAYQAYDNGSPWGGFTNFQCLPYDDFPYVEDFETACDWQLINGNLTNKWVWGEASTRNNHYLYISDNNGASNHYTITSSTMVYAVKLFHFDEGWYRFKYDWLAYGEKNYDYLRVALVPASVTLSAGTTLPSGFSYQSLPSGWIALDGGKQLNLDSWWQTTFSEIYVPTDDYMMVFAWRNDSSVGNQPPAAIDNVSIRPVTCLAPVELTTRHVGSSKVSLDWTPVGNENEWEVWLSWYNGNETLYVPYTATTHPFTINGLESGRNYTATVNAICGPDNASFSSNEISFTTSTDPCDNPATFPFTENFDGYEGATSGSVNVLPNCWSRINTTTVSSQQGYPTITEYSYAQSAPNFLYFMSSYIVGSYEDPQDQYAILPPMDHMANLELSLSARIPAQGRNGTFMVGVMTDPSDASTFTQLATLQPTSTTYTQYTIPLDLYTGDGWYIAIKMPAASSSVTYRGLCIDDVTVNYDPLTYAINADGVSVTVTGHKDGTNATGELIIPETKTIDGVTYTVTAIGDYAFYYCEGLTGSLTIPNTVTTIGNWAFGWCTSLSGSLILGNSVTEIGNFAFNNCEGLIGSLTIPNTVTTIGNWAFANCQSLTGSLILGNSVTEIGDYAFINCNSLTGSLTIPNSVTAIGDNAFASCDSFTGSLTLGNSLTSIGSGAFQNCDGFTGSLTIPNSVTTIGSNAFYPCSGFTSLFLGNSVTEIGSWAFFGCTGLTSVTALATTPPTLGEDVFQQVSKTIPVYVPCASLADYQAASGWSVFTNYQCRETLTVYDGTDENNRIPAFIFYFDDFTRSQFVMPADDLAEMIDRPISSMTFYTTSNVSYTTVSDADVYLMEVDYTNISAYEPKENATTVYSGRFSIESTDNGGEMTIYFTTPYTYRGGNLLVGIDNTEDNGYKNIYFRGQTVSGASISGYNGSSTGTIPATQQNFIPQTTFGYAPSMCEPKSLPYTYGFEEEDEFGCWTMLRCHTTTKRDQTACHEGNYGFKFGYNSNPPQYLISPEFEGTEAMGVSFYYKNSQDIYPETFQVGYSTTTKSPNAFTWSVEVTANDQNHWLLYEDSFPAGTKYVAIKYNSYDQFYLFLDDFSFTLDCPPPSQVTFTDVSYTQATVNWVDYSDTYIALYRYDNHQFTDFETGNLSGWTSQGNATWTVGVGDGTSYNSVGAHSGSYNAMITHTTTGNEAWLISPVMNLAGVETVRADFWYTNRNWSGDIDALGLYYRVNGGEWHELWSTTEAHESWTKCSVFLENTANNYQIGFKYTDLYGYGVALDDINIVFYDVATFISTYTAHYPDQSYTFTGLDPESTYTIQMRGICDGIPNPEWTPHISFITATPTQPIFLTDGNWNDASHWSTGTLPAEGSDVVIAANATIPAGYFAVVEEVTLEGGSITVADGGQLKHNTQGLEVTMKKNIVGYDDADDIRNYYLLSFPFVHIGIPSAMSATGSDFYRFDLNEPNAEWRNLRSETFNIQIVHGYLFASPESNELSLTGNTYPTTTETMWDYVVEYDESSANLNKGWELLGNPLTYNVYIYRQTSDGELVPMEVMIYDENGDMQTITCGPIAPMQGFFVHVTETTTVYFSGTAHLNDYVDLGLPSGLLWATCNVGANAPEEYGDYFAWGETQPKDYYDWDTYQYGDGNTFTKYTGSDGLTTLLPEDDAATANWGSGWRMPTRSEWQELYNNTTVTWTIQNGVSGRLFTAANGNSLFLPAAGYRFINGFVDAGSWGYFGSSSLDTSLPNIAWNFSFGSSGCSLNSINRNYGLSVRPVRSASQN